MMQIANNLRYNNCPLCGAVTIHQVGRINYVSPVYYSTQVISLLSPPELWKCDSCHSGFIQNAVPEVESISLYKQGKSEERWASTYHDEPKTKVVAETLKKLFKKKSRVLDIGCNTGEILDFAQKRGCKTFGVEYSLDSLNLLKSKGHIAHSSMEEVEENLDVITAFDLIEHLYDLPKFIEICLDKLSPDGCLVFLTGDICCFWAQSTRANWWYVRYPEHITFPSRKYFELHPKLQVMDWIPTFADRAYDRPKLRVVMSIAKRLLLGDYSGVPALGPDHALIVIKRRNSL